MHEGIIEVIRDKSSEKCDLTGSFISDEHVPELCKFLRECPHKQVVILDRTNIRNATTELAKLPLKRLSLRQTNVNDESVKVLCHSSIPDIDVGRANLTEAGGRLIAEHSKQTRMDVDYTQIPQDVEKLIKARIAANRKLKQEFQARKSIFATPEEAESDSAKAHAIANGDARRNSTGKKL
jgi:hypothetical protein